MGVGGDDTPPRKWGRGLSCTCLTGDFAPLLTMVVGRGEKANIADTGLHWLEGWALPLPLTRVGFWERTFETEHA